ncbi:hypothetical protein DQ238_10310 [Geodermatophilus sp. TF02-6]|uniref:bestrophin-like domain n=1 Tax=Geodermatophilus sp. TF02-6 TaxID=2250575 RepID=UPI000DE92E33|nr:DUF4239 domain-containing protein [Geodermatophilus sp. TF02-6]RBY79579.1 hypothetical protein DQ238_10310 [Geodermatophilus sp. TF02-6]
MHASLIIVILVLPLLVGLWVQHRLIQRSPDSGMGGLSVSDLIEPVRTLAVLLLAFVLVSAYSSYDTASQQAAAEAGAVQAMAESAALLTPESRRDVLGPLQCYARAVAGPDWRAQAEGSALSPIADAASHGIDAALARARSDERNVAVVEPITLENNRRIEARILRAEEGQPAVPGQAWTLMLVTVAITVGVAALLGHPPVHRRLQLAVLVGTVVVYGLSLLIIQDLDTPFTGPAKIEPTAMLDVEQRIAALPDGTAVLPCDGQGRLL